MNLVHVRDCERIFDAMINGYKEGDAGYSGFDKKVVVYISMNMREPMRHPQCFSALARMAFFRF